MPMEMAPANNSATPPKTTIFDSPREERPAARAKGTVRPSERPMTLKRMVVSLSWGACKHWEGLTRHEQRRGRLVSSVRRQALYNKHRLYGPAALRNSRGLAPVQPILSRWPILTVLSGYQQYPYEAGDEQQRWWMKTRKIQRPLL